MAKRNFRYQHIRTSKLNAVPSSSNLKDGELGVNIADGGEKIFLKNSNNDVVSFITEEQIDAKISSETGTTDGKITFLSGAVDSVSGAVDTNTSNIATLTADKFGGVVYDSNSKRINFYGNSSATAPVIAYVDATDFIKDGMVSNVEVKNVTIGGEEVLCLVITFNTDGGKDPINIPISNIFDASNYYTKVETDNLLSSKVNNSTFETYSGNTATAIAAKANAADVYTKSEVDTALSGKVDVTLYDTFTAATNTTLSGKQDTLVSGTNIKTVVNKGLLGSGNVEIKITDLSDIDVVNDNVILDAGSF